MKKAIVIDLRSRHYLVQADKPKCPFCDCDADGATGGPNAPVPGNQSVCLNCAEVAYWTKEENKLKLIPIPPEVETILPFETRIQLQVMQAGIKALIANRNKQR